MNYDETKIVEWLIEQCDNAGCNGFVVGVSGGVDSALTSTLCAHTQKPVIVVGMPIHQEEKQLSRSQKHMDWLCENFINVQQETFDLTTSFETFTDATRCTSELALANFRSRMRMVALYSVANTHNMLVAGTGNKVEDYGVGFFTKYGDGGVDLSPIADLLKSEVRSLAQNLDIPSEIVNATPTDGLWGDNRSDEQQIGASYNELEWALQYYDKYGNETSSLNQRQKEVLNIYSQRHLANKHKLLTPPVCNLN
jgi:NAD+ synthase